MHKALAVGFLLAALGAGSGARGAAGAAPADTPDKRPSAPVCDPHALRHIPARAPDAPDGHEFARRVAALSGEARDQLILSELVAGNIPQFLRRLVPVSITDADPQHPVQLTACVLPDYLAVGSDRDFVLVPMGLEAALTVAGELGFTLPTASLVDAIYRQSQVKLVPQALPANAAMRSTGYFVLHDDLIEQQRDALGAALGELTAGHKKDLVLTSRLWAIPGRVAIYGWHRGLATPIQPLSTVHGARYADYSHGVRLVSDTVYLNGVPLAMESLMADPLLAGLLTREGPWPRLSERLVALIRELRAMPATR